MEDQYNENDNAERRRRISLDDSNYDNKIIHISGAFLFVTLNGALNGKLHPNVLLYILWGLWVLSIGFTMLSFKVSSAMNSADEMGESKTADFYEGITKTLTWLYSITFLFKYSIGSNTSLERRHFKWEIIEGKISKTKLIQEGKRVTILGKKE